MNDDDDGEEEGIAHNLAHVSLIAQAQSEHKALHANTLHTICVCIKAFPESVYMHVLLHKKPLCTLGSSENKKNRARDMKGVFHYKFIQ